MPCRQGQGHLGWRIFRSLQRGCRHSEASSWWMPEKVSLVSAATAAILQWRSEGRPGNESDCASPIFEVIGDWWRRAFKSVWEPKMATVWMLMMVSVCR